ncbi:hypothetical protein AMTRI_Chr13g119050 [Amborella trichopoda]
MRISYGFQGIARIGIQKKIDLTQVTRSSNLLIEGPTRGIEELRTDRLNIAITIIARPYGQPKILADYIILVQIPGHLNGKEIARTEWIREGRVPLHTILAQIYSCSYMVQTIYGVLGIKIWIFVDEE